MNTLRTLIFIVSVINIFVLNNALPVSKNQRMLVLRGRVTFPDNTKATIDCDARLTVELQDTSLMDAPARVIARGTGRATRFPIAFAVKYYSNQLGSGFNYSLKATIRNENNELLYINDVHTPITPLGASRTKFIDIPVINVRPVTTPPTEVIQVSSNKYINMKGEDAVKLIKQDTSLSNVVLVPEGSMIILEYRTDRVRVFINNLGIVRSVSRG